MAASSVDTRQIFKDDIFKGKILLCSGGGSGICRDMTEGNSLLLITSEGPLVLILLKCQQLFATVPKLLLSVASKLYKFGAYGSSTSSS